MSRRRCTTSWAASASASSKAGTVGGRYHIVFRFTDLVALAALERSPERTALLARLDEHVVATSVRRTVGVDHWFDLPAKVEPTVPGGGGGSATSPGSRRWRS